MKVFTFETCVTKSKIRSMSILTLLELILELVSDKSE